MFDGIDITQFTPDMPLPEYEARMTKILGDIVKQFDIPGLTFKFRVLVSHFDRTRSTNHNLEPILYNLGSQWFGITYMGIGKTYLYGKQTTALQDPIRSAYPETTILEVFRFLRKIEQRESYRQNRGIQIDVLLHHLMTKAGLDVAAETERLITLFRTKDWPVEGSGYHKTVQCGEELLNELHPGGGDAMKIILGTPNTYNWDIQRWVEKTLCGHKVGISFTDGRLNARIVIGTDVMWSAGLILLQNSNLPKTVETLLRGKPLTQMIENPLFVDMTITGFNPIAKDDGTTTTVVNLKRTHIHVRDLDPDIDVEMDVEMHVKIDEGKKH